MGVIQYIIKRKKLHTKNTPTLHLVSTMDVIILTNNVDLDISNIPKLEQAQ